jgi:hypothetical protein
MFMEANLQSSKPPLWQALIIRATFVLQASMARA